jgi:hypothetical protein
MTTTYTQTGTITFTITHARYLASKVATDLKRIQRFYGFIPDEWISMFEEELAQLLKNGYLKNVTYGFQRNEKWIRPSLSYTAEQLNNSEGTDDDPGKITPGADINGASFTSYLEYSQAYVNATSAEREGFENSLPFRRGYGQAPGVEGYFSQDRSYFSGGRSLNRSTLNSY